MSEPMNQSRKKMPSYNQTEQWKGENLVNLLKYDGFIREAAVCVLEEKYPHKVIEVALEYVEHAENVLPIITACNAAYTEMEYFMDDLLANTGCGFEETDRFIDWYLVNLARLTDEECRRMSREKAKEHKARMRENALLKDCDNLQKELLRLNLGYEGAKMTAEEIAALPDFNGEAGFIRAILSKMDTNAYSKKISEIKKHKEVCDNAKV